MQPILKIAVGVPLLGPRRAIARVVEESKKYHRTKDTTVVFNESGHVRLRLAHFQGITISKFALDWNKGIYESYLILAGAKDVRVAYQQVDAEGQVYDFDGYYKPGRALSAIFNNLIMRIPAVSQMLAQSEAILLDNIEQILTRDRLIAERTKELGDAHEQIVRRKTAEAQKEAQLELAKVLGGGLAHEIRNSLQPAAFMLQVVGKYQSGLPSVQALSGIPASLNDAIGTLTEAIFEVAEKGGVSEDVVKELVIPRLLEIDGIYRQIEAACATANGESSEVMGAIGPIKNAIGKGLVLAQQFLDYSKMQEIRRGTEQVDLAALVEAVVGEYAESLAAVGISFQTQFEGGDFKLEGDFGQLDSVVRNLVLNARDALADSAEKRLTLRLSRIDKDGVPHIRLVVADTGAGVPAEAREKIFKPFYTTKPATGTGLGLSVVKRIVEAYDGEIDFKSRPEEGTEFFVDLIA